MEELKERKRACDIPYSKYDTDMATMNSQQPCALALGPQQSGPPNSQDLVLVEIVIQGKITSICGTEKDALKPETGKDQDRIVPQGDSQK
ncbi:hypothetical protein STEG23_015772 [Scotinomys teguina]